MLGKEASFISSPCTTLALFCLFCAPPICFFLPPPPPNRTCSAPSSEILEYYNDDSSPKKDGGNSKRWENLCCIHKTSSSAHSALMRRYKQIIVHQLLLLDRALYDNVCPFCLYALSFCWTRVPCLLLSERMVISFWCYCRCSAAWLSCTNTLFAVALSETKLQVVCRRQERKQQDHWFIGEKNKLVKCHDASVE